jgi:uncharacterized membrane protein
VRLPAKLALGALVLLAAAQAVPVRRDNPPVEADLQAPAQVKAILKRACYDCHSHETVWPLQAYVAPLSWLVAHDVKEGREELNFSRWDGEEPRRAAKRARKMAQEIEEHEMPPWLYLLAHPGARLTEADRALISTWADGLAR